jgi:tetratricopeptide (TPR) repeat protein
MRHSRVPSRFGRRRPQNWFSCLLSCSVLVGLAALMIGTVRWWVIWQGRTADATQDTSLISGREAFARGDVDTTITLMQGLLARQPRNAAALTLLTRALVYRSYSDYDRDDDRQTALATTAAAVSAAPRDMDVLAARAFALQADRQVQEAATLAREVLRLEPDQLMARLALGLAYGGAGGYDLALRQNLDTYTAAQNTDLALDALRALAISYHDLGQYQTAIDTLDKAITMNPRLAVLQFERAAYALQLGNADLATTAYYQVLVHDEDNAKAHLRLCELSSTLDQHAAAVEQCVRVTEIAPSWAEGWYKLGREYFLQGDYPRAQNTLRQCSTLQAMQNVPATQRRFECWYLQGQAAEINGDCVALRALYAEYQRMTSAAQVPQMWVYPPQGPACTPLDTPAP